MSNAANANVSVSADWHIAGTGDFNGDARADVLWRSDSGALVDWLGTADGGFVANWAHSGTSLPTDWHVAATGDFNGDGRSDILWRNGAGVVTDWLGTSNGGFATNWTFANFGVPTNWSVVGSGDFNGDGMADVLWRNNSGTIVNWLGDANGGFAANWANAPSGVGVEWSVAQIGDFNGDGRSDVLWRNNGGQITEWLGTTSGGFADNAGNAGAFVATAWHVEPPLLPH